MNTLTDKAITKLQILASMRTGDRVNDYTLSVFNLLRHQIDSIEEAKAIVRPYLQEARPERSDYEIERELNRQAQTAYAGFTKDATALTNDYERKPKWPEANRALITGISDSGPGLYDLWERSPVRWHDDQPHTEEIIDLLFPGNPLLCVGQANWDFETSRREHLRGRLPDMALIVPSAMSAVYGRTQEGRQSEHALTNTGPRQFLVVEFDSGTQDEQAAIIWHLSQYGPLVMVLYSGGRSLHSWWYCQGQDESDGSRLKRFMQYAVTLGGDPAGWTRSQFMRMPDGWRQDKKQRQTVYFYNPEVLQ